MKKNDYIRFYEYTLEKNEFYEICGNFAKTTVLPFSLFMCSYMIFIISFMSIKSKRLSGHSGVLSIVLYVAATLIVSLLIYSVAKMLYTNKVFKLRYQSTNSKVQINEDGLEFSTDVRKMRLPWNYVRKVKQTNNYVFLYYNKHFYNTIPKRVLSEEDLEFIKSKVPIDTKGRFEIAKIYYVIIIVEVICLSILYWIMNIS